MSDEQIDNSSRQTRSAEPYRLPSDLVSENSDDLENILNAIRSSSEIELELNFKSLDGQLTNADRVIGNIAALNTMKASSVGVLAELAAANFTA